MTYSNIKEERIKETCPGVHSILLCVNNLENLSEAEKSKYKNALCDLAMSGEDYKERVFFEDRHDLINVMAWEKTKEGYKFWCDLYNAIVG